MGNPNYETPPHFFEELDETYHFTLDAAASHDNYLLPKYCTLDGTFYAGQKLNNKNGLEYDWTGERVWCNPPYDRTLGKWVAKAAERRAKMTVMLLPPSVDTAWFHDYIYPHKAIYYFERGRIKFRLGKQVKDAPRAGNLVAIF